jgi:hypothetical protein
MGNRERGLGIHIRGGLQSDADVISELVPCEAGKKCAAGGQSGLNRPRLEALSLFVRSCTSMSQHHSADWVVPELRDTFPEAGPLSLCHLGIETRSSTIR